MDTPIDIVIPWVDGDDPEWKKEFEIYKKAMDASFDGFSNSVIRYTDWGTLKYWFRAIEKYMSWINRIFFVTWGHLPDFINPDDPKLRVVRHDEYIPREYLPTFNSNTIEMNLWRIPDLSENFIIFNDDYYVLNYMDEDYYFQNSIVCDEAVESPIMPLDVGDPSNYACWVKANNIILLNRHFNKREVQRVNKDKWFDDSYGNLLERNERLSYWNNFCGFHDPHLPNGLKKSTLEKIWQVEYQALDRSSRNRFRAANDISWFLARYWQLCSGDFVPRMAQGKSILITEKNYREVADIILNKAYPVICLSEKFNIEYFHEIKLVINTAFDELFPVKSSFEK